MIKKAPKDMTAPEFVAFAKERYESTPKNAGSDGMLSSAYFFELMREYAALPAPNPFTEDQLAWMREEQRSGYVCAAKDKDGACYCYGEKAYKKEKGWISGTGMVCSIEHLFICKYLSWDDPEPLCFADYAPLEGADHDA